ncbi:TraR/DksA C4-type zinc finger protein [Insolitispirillum peregrinum]|uniref:TraR/DksA C4-type zinc finger protein n=1 Tax=Insolitispirillum peregrinum TaxID=80876 RepID=UPI00360B295B
MADSIDNAQMADQIHREALLSRRKRPLPNRDMATGSSPARCTGCGDAIPPERRQAVPGTALCADCATDHERRARQQRGI